MLSEVLAKLAVLFRGQPVGVSDLWAWALAFLVCLLVGSESGWELLLAFSGSSGGAFLYRLDGYLLVHGDLALTEAAHRMRRR